MMGYIYKIWNEDNDKLYIGQTSIGIKARWSQHLKNYLTNNAVIYRAMRKHGAGVFHIELIEECDNSLLDEREKYWIAYYDSYHHGYNSTPGGTVLPSGKMHPRVNDTLIKSLWDEGFSISDIQEKTGNSNTTIREHLMDYPSYSIKESIKRASKKSGESKRIAISQWDLNGNFINTYSSLTEASEKTGIPLANIGKCIYWTKDNEMPEKIKPKIYQYDLNGNLLNIYNTKQEAANLLHLDSGSIAKVCQGKRKTCGGFIWKEVNINNK